MHVRCSSTVILGTFMLFTFMPTASPLCCDIEEASDDWPDEMGSAGHSCFHFTLAQSFQPRHEFTLCKVSVLLEPNPGDTATVYIQDAPCSPANVYTWASRDGIASRGWYEFDVPNITLNQYQAYYIHLEGNTIWASLQRRHGADPYPRGSAHIDCESRDGRTGGRMDFAFRAYGEASSPVPVHDSISADATGPVPLATPVELTRVEDVVGEGDPDVRPETREQSEVVNSETAGVVEEVSDQEQGKNPSTGPLLIDPQLLPLGVQVGAFRDPDRALVERDRMTSLGFPADTVWANLPGSGAWCRVLVGTFTNPVQAESLAMTLLEHPAVGDAIIVTRGGKGAIWQAPKTRSHGQGSGGVH
jgi:hypothetical protein